VGKCQRGPGFRANVWGCSPFSCFSYTLSSVIFPHPSSSTCSRRDEAGGATATDVYSAINLMSISRYICNIVLYYSASAITLT